MNSKQAKRLRKLVGFHPSESRDYAPLEHTRKPTYGADAEGKPAITGYNVTISSTDARSRYQANKRRNPRAIYPQV